MPDTFVSTQLFVPNGGQSSRLLSHFRSTETDELPHSIRMTTGIDAIDRLYVEVDGIFVDAGLIDLDLTVDDWIDADVLADWFAAFNPELVIVVVADESGEDESCSYRIDGKKVRASLAQRRLETVAPVFRAYDLIYDGEAAKLSKLLDQGLDVHARVYKQPLLSLATRRAFHYPELVEQLLARGADPNQPGSEDEWEAGSDPPEFITPILRVCKMRNESPETADQDDETIGRALRALLRAGADPNFGGRDAGLTPLQAAAVNNGRIQANLLLEFGADPDLVDSACDVTPLSLAVENYRNDESEQSRLIVIDLIHAGARTEVTDVNGKILGSMFEVIPEARSWSEL